MHRGLRARSWSRHVATHIESLEPRVLLASDTGVPSLYLPPQFYAQNPGGYLTEATELAPENVARQFLAQHAGDFGLQALDVADLLITDAYRDVDTGLSHVYVAQRVNGLVIDNARLTVTVAGDGRILNVAGGFVADARSAAARTTAPASAMAPMAGLGAISSLMPPSSAPSMMVGAVAVADGSSIITAPALSLDPIPARLTYMATESGLALTWKYVIRTPDGEHWYDYAVDATTGAGVALSDWVAHASYNVFPRPIESPSDGTRGTVTDPADTTYSPYGWHDTNGAAGAEYTDTRGNNVSAQEDTDASNSGGFRPDGGSGLTFDFTLDLTQSPSAYQSAAITNLFYWNNLLHDIHAAYGFTEVAGNFQVKNYSGLGLGNDAVQADAQDGSGTNNANFYTPPDGSMPRMQMYLFNYTSPNRDGDLDNPIIVHEYGHGVSNRLTGGPANSNALSAVQSGGMGEGWSDWWSLMLTQKASDTKMGTYPVGTYVLGQSPTGAGIRRYPYSFDMTKNPQTIAAYNTSSEVHNTGELWCDALWDLNWLLIDKYGFDANVQNGYVVGGPNAGNVLALRLVMDALKIQPANPSFKDARDAILQADVVLTGGSNVYQIWSAFARRGMGSSFVDTSSSATSVTAAFDLPASLQNPVVVSQTPASTTGGPVTAIDLTFSKAMDTASFDPAVDIVSFTGPGNVNLKSQITGFSWINTNQTLHLTLASQSVDGPYTLVVGPNILAPDGKAMDQNQNGTPGEAGDTYSGTFRVDVLPGQVTSTVPASGSSVALPLTAVTLNFNEPYLQSSLSASDLVISQGTVSSVAFTTSTSATFTLSGIVNEGTLTYALAAGAITDAAGNAFQAFSGTLSLDSATAPFAALVQRGAPGTLYYDGSLTGLITPATDTDSFTLSLDAGQRLSVSVVPAAGLRPTLELRDPSNTIIATATAGANGQATFLQAASVTAAGTYTITVASAGGTSGTYTLKASLNAALETENWNGATNDTFATAQNLSGVATTLPGGGSITTVLGTVSTGLGTWSLADFESGAGGYVIANGSTGLWHLSTGRGAETGHSATTSFYYGKNETSTGGGTYDTGGTNSGTITSPSIVLPSGVSALSLTFNYVLKTEGSASWDKSSVQISTNGGTSWTELAYYNGIAESTVWKAATPISLLSYAGQTVQLRWSFNTIDPVGNAYEGWYVDDIRVQVPQSLYDYYAVTLAAGDSLSAAVEQLNGAAASAAMSLYDSSNKLVARASAQGNFEAGLSDFVAPTAGTYYLLVTGSSASDYALTVTKNAGLSVETNNTTATAQPLLTAPVGTVRSIIGHVGGTGDAADLYAVTLTSGVPVTLKTFTPADGTGEFSNTLNPRVRILDAAGTVAASDDNSAPDARNALLTFTPAGTGTYYLEVSSSTSAATAGEYVLTADGAAPPTLGFSATATSPAAGSTPATTPTQATLTFSRAANLASVDAADLLLDGTPATAVVINTDGSATFTLPAGMGPGAHTLTIAAGAILDISGLPLAAFSSGFTMVVGPVTNFTFDPIAGQVGGIPFSVTARARDANGFPVTTFAGAASLSGWTGTGTTSTTMLGSASWTSQITGTVTAGYSFTPLANVTLTHVRSAFGTKVSIWTESGQLLASQAVTGSTGVWTETALSSPITLAAGVTYRVTALTTSAGYLVNSGTPPASTFGTISKSYTGAGDVFPTTQISGYVLVDLRGNVSTATPVPTTPASVTFADGVWTGPVTLSPTTSVTAYLHADNGLGRAGDSTPFAVQARVLTVGVAANVNETGGSLTGTVSITTAPQSDLTVTLASSDPARLAVPASVVILAGQTSASFSYGAVDNALLDGPQSITITATAPAIVSGTATVSVHDDETATLTVTPPASAKEGDTGVTGTITASAAPTRPITLTLTSSLTGRATVPATVTLPAGQTTVSFPITIVNNTSVDYTQSVSLTATTENWTPGTSAISVQDNDNVMTLAATTPAWEFTSATATLTLGGIVSATTTITLASSDTTEMTVPASVTIPAGYSSVSFTITYPADATKDGAKTATLTATAANITTATKIITVNDADLDHLTWDAITGPKTAGVAFSAAVRAYNIDNQLITTKAGTLVLSATGQGGGSVPLSITTGTMNAGVWTGSLSVNGVDPAVTLAATMTAVTGNSATFTVQSGALASFSWSAIGATQTAGSGFPVTITAKDANGYPVTSFNSSAALNAYTMPTGTSSTLFGTTTTYNGSWSAGTTIGYAFTPSADLTVTHLRSLFGGKASIWTNTGTLLATTTLTGGSGAWLESALAAPLALNAGVTYRITGYSSSYSELYRSNVPATNPLGTLSTAYYSSGDTFPINTDTAGRAAMVDIKAIVGVATPLPITPTSATFVNGVWTGSVAALQEAATASYITVSDGAGHTGSSTTFTVKPGNIAPSAVDLASVSDSGGLATDNITNLNNDSPSRTLQFDIAGTSPGATVTLYANGAAVGSTIATEFTTTVFTDGQIPFADGTYTFTARQTVPGYPESAASPALSVTIDTVAPAAPAALDLPDAQDTGVSSTDNITNINAPTFALAGTPYSRLFRNGTLLGKLFTSGTSIMLPTQPDGTWSYTVAAVDAAGNVSPQSAPLSVTIDTTPPAPPAALNLQAASDTGVSDTDNITRNTTLVFDIATPAPYRVYRDTTLISSLNETGSTFTATIQPEGTFNYAVGIIDVAGNVGLSSPLAVRIDNTAPTLAVPDLPDAQDTGSSKTDNITRVTSPVMNLTVNEAAVLSIVLDGQAPVAATQPAAGAYAFNTGTLPDGAHTVSYSVTDLAGNVAPAASPVFTFTIDNVAPSIIATTPGTSGKVAPGLTALDVTFADIVDALTIATTDVSFSSGAANGFSIINASTIRFRTSAFTSPGAVTFTLPAGAFSDVAGNTSSAFTGSFTVVTTTLAADDAVDTAPGQSVLTDDVLANDRSEHADALTVTAFTQPASGTVTLVGGKQFLYVPTGTGAPADSFTYTVTDTYGATSTATVRVLANRALVPGDSATFGFGPEHTGYTPTTLSGLKATSAWTATVPSLNRVTVVGNRVFATTNTYFGATYAAGLNAATGAELWRHTFNTAYSLNQASYFGGALYMQRCDNSGDTHLWALDPVTGATIWSAPFSAQWEHYSAPAVSSNGIWINGGTYGGMYGFTLAGTQIAFVSLAQVDGWAPSLTDNAVYSYVTGNFVKYTLTGTPVWTNAESAGASSSPVTALDATRAYMVGNAKFYAVKLADGTTAWTIPGSFTGSPAIANGRAYAIVGNAVKAYDAATGTLVATYTAESTITSVQPIVTDDALIVSTGNTTSIFHLASGSLLQRIPVGGQLTLADGGLFIAGSNGTLTAYTFATAAAASTPDLAVASDTGVSTTDNLTNDDTPTFSGTAPAGATVSLLSDGVVVGTGTATVAGAWTITASHLADGVHSIAAAVTGAGADHLAAALAVTIDTAAPSVTDPASVTLTAPGAATANAAITAGDNAGEAALTYAWSLVTAPAGASAPQYSVNNTNAAKNATVTFFQAGDYLIRATVVDRAGNVATSDVPVNVNFGVNPAFVTAAPGSSWKCTYSPAAGYVFHANAGEISIATDLGGAGHPFALNVAGGTLTLAATQHLTGLTLAPGATLDIGTSAIYLDYTGSTAPLALIEAMARSGYGTGDWKGAGLTSSAVAADIGLYTLAVLDNATRPTPLPTFAGAASTTVIVVKFTYVCDIDEDGAVTSNDAISFANNYADGAPATHQGGDLNYNGIFDSNDAILFANAYNETLEKIITAP